MASKRPRRKRANAASSTTSPEPGLLRVFPRRTKLTPDDALAYVGDPPLWRPDARQINAIHISCTFSWDRAEAERLRAAWQTHYPDTPALVGGPAYEGDPDTEPAGPFRPGLYIKPGVTVTSRGCPNRCPWCLVPEREGRLRELEIRPGHTVQDNNLTATSNRHFAAVIRMLNAQPTGATICGLEAARLTDWHADQLRRLRAINGLWFALDSEAAAPALKRAAEKLRWLARDQRRCYVLAAYDFRDTPERTEQRLLTAWDLGFLPMVMLYQPPDALRTYRPDWKAFAYTWSRPAALKAHIRDTYPARWAEFRAEQDRRRAARAAG